MSDPERDLKGATPETLAKALLRNRNPRSESGGKPVRRDQVPVGKQRALHDCTVRMASLGDLLHAVAMDADTGAYGMSWHADLAIHCGPGAEA